MLIEKVTNYKLKAVNRKLQNLKHDSHIIWCDNCKCELDNKTNFKRHQCAKSQKPQESTIDIICRIGQCKRTFQNTYNRDTHEKSCAGQSSYNHMARCQKEQPTVFPKCLFCDKSFLKEAQLWQHCDVCVAPRPCKHCNEVFQGMKELKRHFMECRKKYQCQICQKYFKSNLNLEQHLTTAHKTVENSNVVVVLIFMVLKRIYLTTSITATQVFSMYHKKLKSQLHKLHCLQNEWSVV